MALPDSYQNLKTLRNWEPFWVIEDGERGEPPRPISTLEGIGDRLRSAAFAELQARDGFLWASETLTDAPLSLKRTWKALAQAEDRHLHWLLSRMAELDVDPRERPVGNQLWNSLLQCQSAKEFAFYMAGAEERGRRAAERFHQNLKAKDPTTADLFQKIAEEEIAHIAVAKQYFGERPSSISAT